MILTDTHTHLYAEEFDPDRNEVIKSAIDKGIKRFFLPNIEKASIESMLLLEKKYPEFIFPMMGLHPCSVKENWEDEMKVVEDWLERRSFSAIGEMGIDLYWDRTHMEEQKFVFQKQVKLANKYKRPIVIHSRESFEVIYELLKEFPKEPPCGIFHCFTGNPDQARRAIEMGFYLGIGGVLTFKNSGLDKVISELDFNHLVLETDAPYLAPAPHRGKRNDPSYLVLVAKKLAEIKNVTLEEIAEHTTENSKIIFGI